MKGSDRTLKGLVWLYFALLIFEGALRKWIVPSLSGPLLVVRDPVVLAIYALAIGRGIFRMNGFLASAAVLALLGCVASLQGVGTPLVTLFGVRADFLHLPLIFLLPRIFDADDVRRMGRWMLLLTLPMAVLALLQFRAGPESWLNAGAGGALGAQLFVGEGRVRPPGTFSFVNGMVVFLALAAAFLLDSFLHGQPRERLLRFAVLPALVLALAVSGSRAAVVSVTIVCGVAAFICLRMRARFMGALRTIALAYAAYLALGFMPLFREGVEVTGGRFTSGGGVREGIMKRYFGDLTGALDAAVAAPVFGYGIGVGTNAGAGILQGQRGFLLAESEWARVVLEGGAVLGFAFIILRGALVLHIGHAAWRALGRGNFTPMLLLGACGLNVLAGKYGQPTEGGFAMLCAGLVLAAATRTDEAPPANEELKPQAEKPLPRGRAAYAERLHNDLTP